MVWCGWEGMYEAFFFLLFLVAFLLSCFLCGLEVVALVIGYWILDFSVFQRVQRGVETTPGELMMYENK